MFQAEFPLLSPFRPDFRHVFGTDLHALKAFGTHLGHVFGPGFERLGMDRGTGRRRHNPIVERFQVRFRKATAAI